MKILKVFDEKDYNIALPRLIRNAVRAIIIKNDRIVLVRSDKFGEYKFPGGGMEAGESQIDTLIRETREETGFSVKPESVKEYGMVREIRKSIEKDEIFEQNSFYYTCDVNTLLLDTDLDEYEIEYGYKLEIVSIVDAIAVNESLPINKEIPWVQRELFVLKKIL